VDLTNLGETFLFLSSSGWIVIPAVRSVQNSQDCIYFIWLEVTNDRTGGTKVETDT